MTLSLFTLKRLQIAGAAGFRLCMFKRVRPSYSLAVSQQLNYITHITRFPNCTWKNKFCSALITNSWCMETLRKTHWTCFNATSKRSQDKFPPLLEQILGTLPTEVMESHKDDKVVEYRRIFVYIFWALQHFWFPGQTMTSLNIA